MSEPQQSIAKNCVPRVLEAVLQEYALPLSGFHGIAHWARVFENGERLAQITQGDLEVVRLFAVLHDSKRVNEGYDPQHGPRAAEFALQIRGEHLDLTDEQFALLHRACSGHTHERTHPNVTIQTCWDADRLDLGRVGVVPHPSRLCTEAAKSKEMIQWADSRAGFDFVPERVAAEWGIQFRRH